MNIFSKSIIVCYILLQSSLLFAEKVGTFSNDNNNVIIEKYNLAFSLSTNAWYHRAPKKDNFGELYVYITFRNFPRYNGFIRTSTEINVLFSNMDQISDITEYAENDLKELKKKENIIFKKMLTMNEDYSMSNAAGYEISIKEYRKFVLYSYNEGNLCKVECIVYENYFEDYDEEFRNILKTFKYITVQQAAGAVK